MQRTLVTHAFTSQRPTDWASVLSLMPQAAEEAAKVGIKDFTVSRLMGKAPLCRDSKHSTRDIFDWCSADVAVLVEGWVEKE